MDCLQFHGGKPDGRRRLLLGLTGAPAGAAVLRPTARRASRGVCRTACSSRFLGAASVAGCTVCRGRVRRGAGSARGTNARPRACAIWWAGVIRWAGAVCGRVLDIGCGLGGTLEAIGGRVSGALLTGLNIDRRQLRICQGIALGAGNSLTLTEADACALPFETSSFDYVFCVEAMFHFRSRSVFLTEAARVLRPGERWCDNADISVGEPGDAAPWNPGRGDGTGPAARYGPWPQIWTSGGAMHRALTRSGELVIQTKKLERGNAAELPGHGAGSRPEPSWNPGAGEVMRWLHVNGWLTYEATLFRRR